MIVIEFHTEKYDGFASENGTYTIFYANGKKRKELDKYGTLTYFDEEGKMHKDDGPAVVCAGGHKTFYIHGYYYRPEDYWKVICPKNNLQDIKQDIDYGTNFEIGDTIKVIRCITSNDLSYQDYDFGTIEIITGAVLRIRFFKTYVNGEVLTRIFLVNTNDFEVKIIGKKKLYAKQLNVTVDKITREEIRRRDFDSDIVKITFKDGSVKEYSGGMIYYNEKGQTHREDGPAYVDKISGNEYYYLFGVFYEDRVSWSNAVSELFLLRTYAAQFGYTLTR